MRKLLSYGSTRLLTEKIGENERLRWLLRTCSEKRLIEKSSELIIREKEWLDFVHEDIEACETDK